MASSPRVLVLETSVLVDAAPEAVWKALLAVDRWPDWSRDCVEATHDDALDAPGAELSFRLRMLGIPVPFAPTVTAAEAPRQLVWTSEKWTVTGTRTHRLEALDGGRTRVTDRKQFEHAWLPIAWFYPRPVITRMSRRWLDDLAAHVEGR